MADLTRVTDRVARPADDGRPAALVLLQAYAILLTVLPARLVIAPFGAFGAPASLVGLAAFGLWAAGAARPGLLVRTVRPVRVALFALWIPGLISYAVMHMHYNPSDELNAADRWLLQMLVWSGVALLAAEGLRNRSDVMRLLRVVVTGVAFAALVAILQSRFAYDLTVTMARLPGLTVNGELASVVERVGRARAGGTATHPLELASVLTITLGPAMVLAAHDVDWVRWKRLLAVFLIALAVPNTISRTAVVGAILVAVFWFAGVDWRTRARGLVTGLVFMSFFVLVSPGLLGALRNMFVDTDNDNSVTMRLEDYAAVAPFLRNSPWIGRGPGTFLPKFRVLDNQWLLSLVEIGVIGTAGLLFAFLTIAWLGSALRQASRDELGRGLGQALIGSAAVMIWGCTTWDFMTFQMASGIVAVYLGIAGGLYATAMPPGTTEVAASSADREVLTP